jgi:glutathione peroxidase
MVLLTALLSFVPSASAAAPAAQESTVSDKIPLAGLVRLDGTPMPASELEGKAVLFVTVASKCGYTPQYDALQKLWLANKDRGLVIVGVPSNQFGAQEPGTAEEIASFCRLNYGVTFPLLEKQDVNGAGRKPLYTALVGSPAGAGADVKWNFEKFLVGKDGTVKARFGSKTTPDSAELATAIDAALAG